MAKAQRHIKAGDKVKLVKGDAVWLDLFKTAKVVKAWMSNRERKFKIETPDGHLIEMVTEKELKLL